MIPNSDFDKYTARIGFKRKTIERCVFGIVPDDEDEGRFKIEPRIACEIKFLMQWPRVEIIHALPPRGFKTDFRKHLFFRACPRRRKDRFGWIRCYPATMTIPGCRWHECAVFESDCHDGWGKGSRTTRHLTMIVPGICECIGEASKRREGRLAFRSV